MKKRINMTLEEKLIELLKEVAQANHRSVSNQAEVILMEKLMPHKPS